METSTSKDLPAKVNEVQKTDEGDGSLSPVRLTWAQQFRALTQCKRAAAACFACSSAAVLIGYDMTLIGSIIAVPSFVQHFGVWNESTGSWTLPANQQLVWSIVQYISAVVGAFGSAHINEFFGRRIVFYTIVGLTMVGTIVELFSPNWKVWIVAKLLFGAAMGLMQSTIPAYVAEIAPSHIRGFLLALFQFWIQFGAFVAACVLEPTSKVHGYWGWRSSIISQLGLGVFCLAVFIPLVPESPYHLVSKGKTDAARASLLTLRGQEADYRVDEDLKAIIDGIEESSRGKEASPSYKECFQNSNLRRTFLACLPMIMQHFVGYPLCGNYLAYFLSLSGVDNSFLITVISLVCALVAILVAFVLIEYVGRRPQYLFGTFAILPLLLCIGILGFRPLTVPILRGVSALCIIWAFLWYMSVGAVGWTIVGEIATPRLRSMTTSLAALTNSLINMGWSIAIPYLVNTENANLGPKAALVFFGPATALAVLAYFVIPETKGKTFAQLDELFQRRTPARKF